MLNVIIPMAGRGKRFQDAGYSTPKPFIEVFGMTMIGRVVANMPISTHVNLHFVGLKEHTILFFDRIAEIKNIMSVLSDTDVDSINEDLINWIPIDGITEGAACTVMEALKNIPEHEPVIVANSDQFIDWSPSHFLDFCDREDCDGAIPTFFAADPKWSFAYVKEDRTISAVAEKQLISTNATCGVYYFKRCGDIINAIDTMISKGLRVNNEYYLAPAYNEMILDGKKIINYPVPRMYGMGTPEDLHSTISSEIFGTFEEKFD